MCSTTWAPVQCQFSCILFTKFIFLWVFCRNLLLLGKGAKKNKEKKLTSVSFALTHTYTPVKTNIFPFFPKRTWKILKNVQKRKN